MPNRWEQSSLRYWWALPCPQHLHEVKLLHRSRCPSHFDLPFPMLIILEHIYFSLSLSYYVLLLMSSDSVRKITLMGIYFFHEFTYEKLWWSCKHREGVWVVAFTCECPNILESGHRVGWASSWARAGNLDGASYFRTASLGSLVSVSSANHVFIQKPGNWDPDKVSD